MTAEEAGMDQTWWDVVSDPQASTGRRVLAGIGCGVLPWVCISQEATRSAGERVDDVRASVSEPGGVMDELRETIGTTGEAAAAPARAAADAIMWGSIGLGILLLLVLLGLFTWYVLLPFARGGPRG